MTTVWLGRGVSNNIALIDAVSQLGCEVVVSHVAEKWAGQEHAVSFSEPNVAGAAYVEWMARTLEEKSIDFVIPGRCLGDFEHFPRALRQKLVLGCAPHLSNTVDDKGLFYHTCQEAVFDFVADCEVFANKDSFERARTLLREKGHNQLCFKPTKGVFGAGFRVLSEGNPLRTLATSLHTISVSAYKS